MSGWGLNLRPPTQQTGALPTELTGGDIKVVTWNSTHKPDKPEANSTFVSTLVLHFMVVKATSSYTERKEVRARI